MKGILKTDGGARGNPGKGASAALLFSIDNELLNFTGKYFENTTNNNAEYWGLVIGMKMAIKEGIDELECYLDSELIVKQMKGEYKIKDENIKTIKILIDDLLPNFNKISFNHIVREKNKLADRLVNLILDEHEQ